ncbi:MAG: type II toxin-antitoxin system PemK/MazF family toxin [Myxococcota bacterium]
MARRVTRGDVWLYEFKRPDKRRPVVVVARQDAVDLLPAIVVAPVTSTIRGLPSEVVLDERCGLKHPSAVMLDALQCVEKARLRQHLGTVPPATMRVLCRALAVAVGCDESA